MIPRAKKTAFISINNFLAHPMLIARVPLQAAGDSAVHMFMKRPGVLRHPHPLKRQIVQNTTSEKMTWAKRMKPHFAATCSQVIFGTGTVLVGSTLIQHPMNPVIFAFIRERCLIPSCCLVVHIYSSLAALVLGTVAAFIDRRAPALNDLPRIFAVGVSVWVTNLTFVFGVQWVSEVLPVQYVRVSDNLQAGSAAVATLMQPLIPVVTTLMAVAFRYEGASIFKFIGVFLASLGAALIVALGDLSLGTGGDQTLLLWGVLAFVAEACSNAATILLQKYVQHFVAFEQ
jgi:drug/metabolite transporter (DMT)-like permease